MKIWAAVAVLLALGGCESTQEEDYRGGVTAGEGACSSLPAATLVAFYDFDSGLPSSDFSSDTSGSSSGYWFVDSTRALSAPYSAGSGFITHGEYSGLTLALAIPTTGISFWYSTSSEAADPLGFFIDADIQGSWSGEKDWNFACFTHASATVSYNWVYTKDGAGSEGFDAAWVDDVTVIQ